MEHWQIHAAFCPDSKKTADGQRSPPRPGDHSNQQQKLSYAAQYISVISATL
jgi:hypothetical protein